MSTITRSNDGPIFILLQGNFAQSGVKDPLDQVAFYKDRIEGQTEEGKKVTLTAQEVFQHLLSQGTGKDILQNFYFKVKQDDHGEFFLSDNVKGFGGGAGPSTPKPKLVGRVIGNRLEWVPAPPPPAYTTKSIHDGNDIREALNDQDLESITKMHFQYQPFSAQSAAPFSGTLFYRLNNWNTRISPHPSHDLVIRVLEKLKKVGVPISIREGFNYCLNNKSLLFKLLEIGEPISCPRDRYGYETIYDRWEYYLVQIPLNWYPELPKALGSIYNKELYLVTAIRALVGERQMEAAVFALRQGADPTVKVSREQENGWDAWASSYNNDVFTGIPLLKEILRGLSVAQVQGLFQHHNYFTIDAFQNTPDHHEHLRYLKSVGFFQGPDVNMRYVLYLRKASPSQLIPMFLTEILSPQKLLEDPDFQDFCSEKYTSDEILSFLQENLNDLPDLQRYFDQFIDKIFLALPGEVENQLNADNLKVLRQILCDCLKQSKIFLKFCKANPQMAPIEKSLVAVFARGIGHLLSKNSILDPTTQILKASFVHDYLMQEVIAWKTEQFNARNQEIIAWETRQAQGEHRNRMEASAQEAKQREERSLALQREGLELEVEQRELARKQLQTAERIRELQQQSTEMNKGIYRHVTGGSFP